MQGTGEPKVDPPCTMPVKTEGSYRCRHHGAESRQGDISEDEW